VLELYLYIVVSLIVRLFPAYFTPVHVLYIVAFGLSGIQVAIPNKCYNIAKKYYLPV
jgi:uncharacterized membrane protein